MTEKHDTYTVGPGGCCAMTNRKGTLRHCGQRACCRVNGRPYCYYHDPRAPKKFGEGYLKHERPAAGQEE